jgi:hypothetical protein
MRTSEPKPHEINGFASVPLIPKFAQKLPLGHANFGIGTLVRARRSRQYQGICAIGAAYTKAVTARQCDHTVMPRRQSARLARRAAAFFTPEAKAEGKTKRRNAANGTYI